MMEMWTNLLILLIFILLLIIGFYLAIKEFSKKSITSIPFKEAMDLVSLPIVTFMHGEHKLHLLLDTGSDDSYLDSSTNTWLNNVKKEGVGLQVLTGGGECQAEGMVRLKISYNNYVFTNHFFIMNLGPVFKAVTDERGLEINGILGNKFFKRYKYKFDFDKMEACSKKGLKL